MSLRIPSTFKSLQRVGPYWTIRRTKRLRRRHVTPNPRDRGYLNERVLVLAHRKMRRFKMPLAIYVERPLMAAGSRRSLTANMQARAYLGDEDGIQRTQ